MSTPIERIRALVPLPVCDSILECPKCGALAGPALKHIDDRIARSPDLALLVKLADAAKAMREARKQDDDDSGQPSIKFMGAFADAMDILAELEAQ